MPRLTALRVTALARLAADLRFAPTARVVAIVRAAERLAPTIDPDDVVDERDLVYALTAYRPDLDEPASIPGDALLADLSAWCERLTDSAKIDEAAVPGARSPDDVARRWNVSVKTVSRRRREGLIAWRVRTSGGSVAVRISPEALGAFESAHDLLENAPGRVTRLTPTERARLVRLARRAQRRFAWTRTETAKRLSARTGRSYETVRRTLTSELGPPIPPASAKRRRDAHRRWMRGEPGAAIARAVSRTPQSVRRWIDAERRAAVLALELPAPEPPADAHALASALAQSGLGVVAHDRAGAFVESARSAGPADPAALRTLDAAHTAALVRARASALTPGGADEAETALRWARLLGRRIASMHTRLTLAAIESAVGGPLLQLSPPAIRALHAEAMRAVLEGIARHDARVGGTVSGAINLALTRRLARTAELGAARRALASGNRAESPGAGLDDWTRRPPLWPDPLWGADPERTEDAALRAWAGARRGLDGQRPLSLPEAAAHLGLTPARAARLDRAARALAG